MLPWTGRNVKLDLTINLNISVEKINTVLNNGQSEKNFINLNTMIQNRPNLLYFVKNVKYSKFLIRSTQFDF